MMSRTDPPGKAGTDNVPASPGTPHEAAAAVDVLPGDDELRRELERLAAENRELFSAIGLKPTTDGEAAANGEPDPVRAENAALRARVAELERLAALGPEATWGERQTEYETLLEEKSEVIRGLHQKIQVLQQGGAAPDESAGEEDTGDVTQSGLKGLKTQLERERAQLQEDEEALMQQMKQMELTMARERAELARQRAELQRLHSDIHHELEVANRDGALRDRLASF
jgi:hypothetical protein